MSAVPSILVVDDEANLRRTLTLILKQAGYQVTDAGSGQEMRRAIADDVFDLIFLDLKMPDANGIELLGEIRDKHPGIPVLILTAHATLESAMEAVRLGARDYLLKPVSPPQILSRVQELMVENEHPRRRRAIMSQVESLLTELTQYDENSGQLGGTNNAVAVQRNLQLGPFSIDLHTRYFTLSGEPISLSPTAFDYLLALIRHSPETVTYEKLVMEAQGYKTTAIEAKEIVRWRIHELRKAIEQNPRQPRYIITERNVGYRLVA